MLYSREADRFYGQVVIEVKQLVRLCRKAEYKMVFDAIKQFIQLLGPEHKEVLVKDYAEFIWVSNDMALCGKLVENIYYSFKNIKIEDLKLFEEEKFKDFGEKYITVDQYINYANYTAILTKKDSIDKEVSAPVTTGEILKRIINLYFTSRRYAFIPLLNALPTCRIKIYDLCSNYPAPRAIFEDPEFQEAFAEVIGRLVSIIVRYMQTSRIFIPLRLPEDEVIEPELGKTYFLEDPNRIDLWKVKVNGVFKDQIQVKYEGYDELDSVPIKSLRNWTEANEEKWKHDEEVRKRQAYQYDENRDNKRPPERWVRSHDDIFLII